MKEFVIQYRTFEGDTGTVEKYRETAWDAMSACLEELKLLAGDVQGLEIIAYK